MTLPLTSPLVRLMKLCALLLALVILPSTSGCEKEEPMSAMDQARSRPGTYTEQTRRLANGTCEHTPGYECVEGKPCDLPEIKTVECPYTRFRYARTSRGTCILEPLMRCKSGTLCSVSPLGKPCPPALTDTGFILRKDGVCELTLVKDGERTTSPTPCPEDLPMPIGEPPPTSP